MGPQRPGGARQAMTAGSDAAYRCPKCGASVALRLPQPVLRESHVALKCVQCAHVVRMPRQQPDRATPRYDPANS